MKIVSVNIKDGSYAKELLKFLRVENPDILLMQEFWKFDGYMGSIVKAQRDVFSIDTEILKYFKGYQSVFSPVLDTKITRDSGEEVVARYGNAIYSKYPILEDSTYFFDIEYIKNFEFPEPGVSFDNQPRNIIKIKLDTPNGELMVNNVHGIYQLNKYKGDSERMDKMVDEILGIQDLNMPTIIAGDFNLFPNTQAIDKMRKIYRELVIENGITSTKVGKDNYVIDYMFINDFIDVKSFKVPNIEVSNHLPVVGEVEIKTN